MRDNSKLHANILDAFQRGGVEITSPHYRAVRDGNASTIPVNEGLPPSAVEKSAQPVLGAEVEEELSEPTLAGDNAAPDVEEPGTAVTEDRDSTN